MNPAPALRVRLTMVLFVLCGLAIGRLPFTTFGHAWMPERPDTTGRFMAKYELLRPYLSPKEPVGYLPAQMDLAVMAPLGRLSLAKYVLSPPAIELTTNRPLVIFESDDLQAMPDFAVREGWTLVADFHNGVKLFRTRALGLPTTCKIDPVSRAASAPGLIPCLRATNPRADATRLASGETR